MKESVLRTLVPLIYAMLINVGMMNLGLDEVWMEQAATLIATLIVYVGLRLAERYQPQIGWLLGYASQPHYEATYVQGKMASKRSDPHA